MPDNPDNLLSNALLIDTEIWSSLHSLGRSADDPMRLGWSPHVRGRVLFICAQTRAEILSGTKAWSESRAAATIEQLNATPTFPVTEAVIQAYAALTFAAIGAADRWIAATAIALGVPLLSTDRLFEHVPGLALIDWRA